MDGGSRNWGKEGRRLLRYARSAIRRLLPAADDRPFLPDYSDAALIGVLGASCGTSGASIQEAIAAWKAGAPEKARLDVVSHFDRRKEPRFFFDTTDAPALARRLARGTQDRLERWTRATTTEGLEVFGHTAPPLKPGFPWPGQHFAAFDDILFAARPHRFAFAPPLACATLAAHVSAEQFRDLLADWSRFAVADRSGLAFHSNLLVTQRLIACSWAYALLGPVTDSSPRALADLKWQLLKLIGQDVGYLRPRLGSSYPNNHLLVDRLAAWYVAVLFPELGFDRAAARDAEALWLRGLERQTYSDGGYFEPSVHYHGLATELVSAYVLLARRQGHPPPEWVEGRLKAMLRFQARLAGPDKQPPGLGDATEDSMFPLTVECRTPQALSALHRLLYAGGRTSTVIGSDPGLEWASWMAGGSSGAPAGDQAPVGFSAFPDMGLFVFSENDETTRLILRTAPSPERSVMPGHMHADLMSVYLVQSGTPLVVDSGTFSYRFKARGARGRTGNWRRYLSGASAHNTVLIGDQDPLAPLEGDFRPIASVPRATHFGCRAGGRLASAAGRLDGPPPYTGLTRGVVHVCDEYFLIWTFIPQRPLLQPVRFAFQLAPGIGVEAKQGSLALTSSKVAVVLAYSSPLVPEAVRTGSEDPVAGWVSSRYGELVPAPQLCFRASGEAPLSAFLFRRSERGPISSIACEMASADMGVIRINGADFADHVLVKVEPGEGRRVPLEQMAFEGEVLWTRRSLRNAVEVRALAARMFALPEHGVAWRCAAEPEDFEYPAPRGARIPGSSSPAGLS